MIGTAAFAAVWRALGRTATVFLALTAVVLLVVLAPRVIGYESLVVQSDSMGNAYPVGSVVTVRPVAPAEVAVGDVILIRRPGSPPVLHRVVDLHREAGKVLVETKGDANPTQDPGDYVLSNRVFVATMHLPKFGYLLQWGHTPLGWVVMQAFPASLIAAWIIMRVWDLDGWFARRMLRGTYA